MHRPGMVSIWFFIGSLLLIYGVLIFGAGLYGLSHPPAVTMPELHAGLWWGVLLIVLGAIYFFRFAPWRAK